jgi:hypothetical protein
MKTFAVTAFSLFSLVACARSSSDGPAALGSPSTTAASPAKAPEAKGPKIVTLAKYGLKGTAPGETEDPMIGDGEPAMVMAAGFTVSVGEAKPTDPKKVKDGQEAAKLFNPKNMQTETLADGWALTYENTGSAGTNYFVNVRRDIGGKGYLCDTMQSTPAQQKAALEFCKSLTK